MKFNWYQVVILVLLVIAAVGWVLYVDQREVSNELMSKAPRPTVIPDNRLFGNFQKYENGMLTVGVRSLDDDKTLLTRTFPVSTTVTVVQFDPVANDYSGAAIESFEAGVWLLIDTDDSGTVIAITAGQ